MFRKTLVILIAAAAVMAMPASSYAKVYTLDECVGLALESNLTLAMARESLTAANADVLSSWSGVLPRVSGSMSSGKSTVRLDGDESTGKNANASIGLSQTLFDGSTFANISATRHGREATAYSFEATRRDVIFNTQQAYYGLLKAEALRDVQSEALDLAREQLRKTQSLFELGSASKSDLLKAQVQVSQAELALISARRVAETARAGLCYILGLSVTTDMQVTDPPQQGTQVDTESYNLNEALARRPDVMAAEEQLKSAKRSLLSAKAGRWPDLGFSMSYSRSEETLGDLFDDLENNHSRSVSLGLSVPIFNGLATKASIDRSKSSLRSAEISLRDTKLYAQYEIETSRLAAIEQSSSVEVAQASLAQAEEDLKVSEERFRLRAASMLELIDAQVAYSTARAALVEARYDYEIAKAELVLALGL